MIKFLDLNDQYIKIKDEIDDAISSVINDSAFIGGKYVNNFESAFSDYISSKFCVGVGNGTDALEIAIEAAQLPVGSEIIVPGNSFIASSEAVTRMGHKVVFCDVTEDSYVISTESLKKAITNKTSAIIAVHLYGHPCDMDPIMDIANQFGLIVIEDCAQAHGAKYKDRTVGTIGHFGTFSFYPGKNLGGYGDGGAITTQEESYAIKARMIANHGRIAKYDHEFEGRNSRLDAIQASILSAKLKHLHSWTERRIEIANLYLSGLSGVSQIELPKKQPWAYQVYHLFVIRCENRDDLKTYLTNNGVQVGTHYPVALSKLQAYDYLDFANVDTFYNRSDSQIVSLPIGDHLTNEDIHEVISLIDSFYK